MGQHFSEARNLHHHSTRGKHYNVVVPNVNGMTSTTFILTLLRTWTLFQFHLNQECTYNDEAKCDLLNKYFSFISKLANAALPDIELKTNYNISDFNVIKMALPLQIIFNKSLQQSKYPTNWKLAHAIAVFKKGNSSLPSNYRPISLINCVGKILTRVICKHVYNYLHKNKLIYDYQSVFFPGIQQYINY